jgi:hypothetical protein
MAHPGGWREGRDQVPDGHRRRRGGRGPGSAGRAAPPRPGEPAPAERVTVVDLVGGRHLHHIPAAPAGRSAGEGRGSRRRRRPQSPTEMAAPARRWPHPAARRPVPAWSQTPAPPAPQHADAGPPPPSQTSPPGRRSTRVCPCGQAYPRNIPTWQLSRRPSAPEYCRPTSAEYVPFLAARCRR